MRLFATGASGLIGSHLRNIIPIKFELIDSISSSRIVDSIDSTVIHLAGIVGEDQVQSNLSNAFMVNVKATCDFARFIKERTKARFIFVSSSHVYKYSTVPHKESDAIEPIGIYGQLKWESEKLISNIFSDSRERLCTTRVFSVLGSNMRNGTLGWAAENLHHTKSLKNCDDERDFMTPLDVANTLSGLARLPFKFPIINICSGERKKVGIACREFRSSLGLKTSNEWLLPGTSAYPIIIGDRTLLNKSLIPLS